MKNNINEEIFNKLFINQHNNEVEFVYRDDFEQVIDDFIDEVKSSGDEIDKNKSKLEIFTDYQISFGYFKDFDLVLIGNTAGESFYLFVKEQELIDFVKLSEKDLNKAEKEFKEISEFLCRFNDKSHLYQII